MTISSTAFAAPLSLRLTSAARGTALTQRGPLSARVPRRCSLRMADDPLPVPDKVDASVEVDEGMDVEPASASDILKVMREDSANETGPRTQNSGVFRDADGKSNIWAIEPRMETSAKKQISPVVILAGSAVFILFALLVLPHLPFTNPDQL